jgi:hypothetical protein
LVTHLPYHLTKVTTEEQVKELELITIKPEAVVAEPEGQEILQLRRVLTLETVDQEETERLLIFLERV